MTIRSGITRADSHGRVGGGMFLETGSWCRDEEDAVPKE
jgi:hypothetical protein